jgi:hypothetical protein
MVANWWRLRPASPAQRPARLVRLTLAPASPEPARRPLLAADTLATRSDAQHRLAAQRKRLP